MDWMKIGSALLLVGMLVFVYPRMKQAIKHSPKGTTQDWMGFIGPLVAVIGFIILLIQLV
ncbi:MAG: hypothetical protein PVJ63_00080 [Thioalkalispiraceae bacterium]|jgi:hypothetical protein